MKTKPEDKFSPETEEEEVAYDFWSTYWDEVSRDPYLIAGFIPDLADAAGLNPDKLYDAIMNVGTKEGWISKGGRGKRGSVEGEERFAELVGKAQRKVFSAFEAIFDVMENLPLGIHNQAQLQEASGRGHLLEAVTGEPSDLADEWQELGMSFEELASRCYELERLCEEIEQVQKELSHE